MYRTDFWTLWEKARVGCFKRTASKHVYYLGWNRSPAQVGCMRQALGPGALGRPRGIGWRGRWERELGWGTHVNPWLFHFNVWQNPLQKKKAKTSKWQFFWYAVNSWGTHLSSFFTFLICFKCWMTIGWLTLSSSAVSCAVTRDQLRWLLSIGHCQLLVAGHCTLIFKGLISCKSSWITTEL